MRLLIPLAAVAVLTLAACTSSGSGDDGATAPATAPRSGSSSASSPSAASSSAASSSAGTATSDWAMYHGNPAHDGNATSMPAVGSVKRVANTKLDGAVYASPIVVGTRTVVATENDSVYAFDSSNRQLWKVNLGKPSPGEERQCGNITPLGITGTPIAQNGTVYLVAEMAGNVRHELFALDVATGKTKWSRSVDLPGVSARDMQQRGALAIAHGKVWVAFGAQAGDCGNYKGRVVGISLSGKGSAIYYSPPTERGGGMWNPAGPTVNRSGNLLVVSANGAAFPGDSYDYTNSVLEINASARRVDSFAPSDWAENNQGDVGLGSQSPALVGTKWAVFGGKSGPVYVLRQDKLGGIGGQVSVQDICRSFGGAAVDGNVVYLPCTDGVRAVRVDSAGTPHVLWHASESIQGSPIVGGGRVWTLDQDGGVLHALDPDTGKTREQVTVGQTSRFATPAVRGSEVLVPTLAGMAVVATS